MSNYHKRIILKLAIGFCLLFFSFGAFSQKLGELKLGWGTKAICAKQGVNNKFSVDISFTGVPFSDSNNIFYLELSDENGSFKDSSKVRVLRTLPGNQNPPNVNGARNVAYNFTESFALPEGVFGGRYVIRVRTTSPSMTSESKNFGAYYLPNVNLQLNNYKDVTLCGGESRKISVVFDDPSVDINKYQFQWKIDRSPFKIGGSSIEVSKSGRYRVAIFTKGNCNVNESNEIEVTSYQNESLIIKDVGANVEVCGDETITFNASIDNKKYKYFWYKDDALIDGLNAYQPNYTTSKNNQFGKYRVEVETGGGCKLKSQTVSLDQKNSTSFNATIKGPNTYLILPQETKSLKVTHNASNYEIRWYVDDKLLAGVSGEFLNVTDEGTYFAEVVDRSTECATYKKTKQIKVLKATGFATTIRSDLNYADCQSSNVKLSIVGVKATASDGEEYDLTSEQIKKLKLQWYKNSKELTNETNNELNIVSYKDNSQYYLNTSLNRLSSNSNIINVLLVPKDFKVASSSVSNTLCSGTPIELSINAIEGYTYKWFKDNVTIDTNDVSRIEVNEVGVYKLTYQGFGCENSIDVEIKSFDDSVVEVTPSTKVVLIPGKRVTAKAKGADSYEWFDKNGTLVSSSDELDVNELGVYRLVARVGECSVEKEIKVVEDDGFILLPNILTPFNADGVNDTWNLPNKYAFQNEVQVIIYDSQGKELLNTNDYQNDWPVDYELKDGMIFYYKVIQEDELIKAGTISVLK